MTNIIRNSYGDSGWKDPLTSYDDQSITYDATVNPLNYLGSTLTWQNGRQLAAYSNAADNQSISYSYDVNGLRTEKAVTQNGVTTNYEYLYDGSTLLQEHIGSSKILNFLRLWNQCFNGQLYSYTQFDRMGRQTLRIDYQGRPHAGVLPHIHLYTYPQQGGQMEYTFDLNWDLID